MLKFILKRLALFIPVVLGATLIVFVILSYAQGDPAREALGIEATEEQVEALREEWGLNDPVIVQYGRYIVNLVQGDMGESYKTGTSVGKEIGDRLWATVSLTLVAMALSIIIAIPLGVAAALKRNTFIDHFCMIISMVGVSMPQFWLGLLLMLWLGLKAGILPVSGAGSFAHYILPAVTIALKPMASIARTTRSSMLDELSQDYLQTARSKGLKERTVIVGHALKNSLIPTVTMVGLQLGIVFAGSVVVEQVFSWPGIGRFMLTSINARDIPSVMGCVIVMVVIVSLINLIVDIIYGFIDPRLKSRMG